MTPAGYHRAMETATAHRGSIPLSQRCLARPAARPARGGSFLAVAADGQTYRNLGYLLLACPLGVAYFLFLAVGFALGTALFVTLIGLPVLVATVVGSWRLASFERRLASGLLREPLPTARPEPPALRAVIASGRRDRAVLAAQATEIATRFADPTTFRGLMFLVAKLPLGLLSLATVVAAYGTALALLLAPLTYRFDALAPAVGSVRVDSLEEATVGFLVAPLALLAAMHVANALAAACGRFARAMLAPSAWSGR